MSTSRAYVFLVNKLATDISGLAYQGAAALVCDENGIIYGWDGSAYSVLSVASLTVRLNAQQASIDSLQDQIDALASGGGGSGSPVASGSPSITGTPSVGGGGLVGTHAPYSGLPTSYRGRFYRAGVLLAATEAVVVGAATVPYDPQNADRGLEVVYGEFGRNASGEALAEVFSTPVVISGGSIPTYDDPLAEPPGILNAPGASGGVLLQGYVGLPINNPDPRWYAVQWMANGNDINGATSINLNTSGYTKTVFAMRVTPKNSVGTGPAAVTPGYYIA